MYLTALEHYLLSCTVEYAETNTGEIWYQPTRIITRQNKRHSFRHCLREEAMDVYWVPVQTLETLRHPFFESPPMFGGQGQQASQALHLAKTLLARYTLQEFLQDVSEYIADYERFVREDNIADFYAWRPRGRHNKSPRSD